MNNRKHFIVVSAIEAQFLLDQLGCLPDCFIEAERLPLEPINWHELTALHDMPAIKEPPRKPCRCKSWQSCFRCQMQPKTKNL